MVNGKHVFAILSTGFQKGSIFEHFPRVTSSMNGKDGPSTRSLWFLEARGHYERELYPDFHFRKPLVLVFGRREALQIERSDDRISQCRT